LDLGHALCGTSLYGVWDGHGGIEAADFASDAVPRQLARHPALSRPWVGTCAESDAADVATVEGAGGGDGCADRGEAEGEGGDGCASVLGQVMRLVDNDYLALAQREAHRSGTTVLCALHRGQELLVLNLGDSRAVLARAPLSPRATPSGRALREREAPLEAVRLSCDHTPELPEERRRVLQGGGDVRRISGAWRVVAYVDEQLGQRFDAAASIATAASAASAVTADSAAATSAAASAPAPSAATAPAPLSAAAAPFCATPSVSAAVVACTAASSRRAGAGAGAGAGASGAGAGASGAATVTSGRPMLLSVTRALGDLAFKSPRRFVSCEPHVHARTLDERDRFLILASDGLWDVLSDAEAVHLASDALQLARPGTPPAQQAADALLSRAQKLGTTDNTTVLVVVL